MSGLQCKVSNHATFGFCKYCLDGMRSSYASKSYLCHHLINPQLKPEIRMFFDDLEVHLNNMTKIVRFQKSHRANLARKQAKLVRMMPSLSYSSFSIRYMCSSHSFLLPRLMHIEMPKQKLMSYARKSRHWKGAVQFY